MTSKSSWRDSGVSRREVMRLGAGGLGFSLFGGIGPVPHVLSQASRAAAASPLPAGSWWSSSGSAATTG